MEKIEVPGSWFIGGFLVLGTAAVVLGHLLFHIHWWMGVIAVLATFFLVVVGGARDRRDRHHPGRAAVQDHAAHLRRASRRAT